VSGGHRDRPSTSVPGCLHEQHQSRAIDAIDLRDALAQRSRMLL
jgi:hypothetical protein